MQKQNMSFEKQSSAQNVTNNLIDKYPELRGVNQSHITPEQARQLDHLLTDKILALSRNNTLSEREISLIGSVTDMTARNIQYGVDKGILKLPNPDNTRYAEGANLAWKSTSHIAREKHTTAGDWPTNEEFATDPNTLSRTLSTVTGVGGFQNMPHLRANFEDAAIGTTKMFTEMVVASGGLDVDRYMEGNISNMLAQYEMVEQQ